MMNKHLKSTLRYTGVIILLLGIIVGASSTAEKHPTTFQNENFSEVSNPHLFESGTKLVNTNCIDIHGAAMNKPCPVFPKVNENDNLQEETTCPQKAKSQVSETALAAIKSYVEA